MLNIIYCSFYKYVKLNNEKINESDLNTKYLFIYPENINILHTLNINFDKNLNRLVYYLKNKKIDFIFLFYEDRNLIHSSGVCTKKNSIDKFFYDFQKENYAVIGPTYTNKSYRGKQYYSKALGLQIKNIIENHKIEEIFISTEQGKKKLLPFENNNLKKFSSGLLLSVFNKIFIYVIYEKMFKLRAFFVDSLIFRLK